MQNLHNCKEWIIEHEDDLGEDGSSQSTIFYKTFVNITHLALEHKPSTQRLAARFEPTHGAKQFLHWFNSGETGQDCLDLRC